MTEFQIHAVDTAPEGSCERLAQLEATRGFVGSIFGVPIYSRAAEKQGLDPETVRAIRNGEPVTDPRAAALSDLTAALVSGRGRVPDEAVQTFLDAGFDRAQLLEVLGGIALKSITNYLTQFVAVPLEDDLKPFAWEPT